jgi:hypothetical protein
VIDGYPRPEVTDEGEVRAPLRLSYVRVPDGYDSLEVAAEFDSLLVEAADRYESLFRQDDGCVRAEEDSIGLQAGFSEFGSVEYVFLDGNCSGDGELARILVELAEDMAIPRQQGGPGRVIAEIVSDL